ncbi:MAG: histidine phosphatase family protein [Actinomycetota bacterium]|nr:histidine phosphatase family protein [Actinomycetota bacterium]
MNLLLVRHGAAGSRHKWPGPDKLRSLSPKGRRQARGIADLLADRPIARVLSSSYVRCVQTVEPLADKLGLAVEPARALAEGTGAKTAMALVRSLDDPGAVVCSHGDLIPIILETLAREDGFSLSMKYPCAKGSTWDLVGQDGVYMEAHYIPPPA